MPATRDQIVPYVVPSTYPPVPEGWCYSIGHGVRVMLAVNQDMVVRNLSDDEIPGLGLASIDECWATAHANIDRVFRDQTKAAMFPAESPDLVDLILCGDTWLAASCIVRPGLHAWASKNLGGQQQLLVSIPNPEALLIFPRGTAPQRAAMRARIRGAEAEHRKPITWELFELSAAGIEPFQER